MHENTEILKIPACVHSIHSVSATMWLYLNDGIHQCVEQRDDGFARVPSLSLQRKHTLCQGSSTADGLRDVLLHWY